MTTDRHCLDAETLAAWIDGGLDAAGVAAAEAHASTCERCQALLATVVKTLPADQQSAVVSGFSPLKKHQSLWRWWLAPLAATAAAVTIWMVVPQTPMQPPMQPPAAAAPARDLAADAAAKPQAVPAEPGTQAAPAAPAATPPASLADARRNVPTPANEPKAKLTDTAAAMAKADASELERKDAQGKREENSARAAELRQAVEAAPAPPTAAERMREAPAASASAREQSGELRRDKPPVGAVTQLRKQVSTPTVVSPNPNSRWRVLAGGTIERSEDAGRTWIPVRIAPNEEVLAGASPGPLACWFVGRNGLVLLATDGTNFTRLPFPESVDLVAVSSPEARIATITTADGRTFRTEDAGRNWRQ